MEWVFLNNPLVKELTKIEAKTPISLEIKVQIAY